MALVFSVTGVDANLQHRQPVSTGFGSYRSVNDLQGIWPFHEQVPGPTLSPRPVAFNLQREFCLKVTGTFPFNAAWRVPESNYTVTGTGPGDVTLQGTPRLVPKAGDTVDAQGFTLQIPRAVIAPFKAAGEWKWTISHQPPTG